MILSYIYSTIKNGYLQEHIAQAVCLSFHMSLVVVFRHTYVLNAYILMSLLNRKGIV